MKPVIIIGIDPGAKGAVACINIDGSLESHNYDGESDLLAILSNYKSRANLEGADIECVLELVGGFIKGNKAPGSAMFNFGANWGYAKGVLSALGIRFRLTRPQDWQRGIGLGSTLKGPERKRALKDIAQRLRPEIKVTLVNADAILLAEWLRKEVRRG